MTPLVGGLAQRDHGSLFLRAVDGGRAAGQDSQQPSAINHYYTN